MEWRELKEVKTIKIAICRKFKRNLKGVNPIRNIEVRRERR